MDCDDLLEKLYPYLDRELSSAELEDVRSHLDHCDGCESSFVLERIFLDRIRSSATSDVCPTGVRERLILRLREVSSGGSASADR